VCDVFIKNVMFNEILTNYMMFNTQMTNALLLNIIVKSAGFVSVVVLFGCKVCRGLFESLVHVNKVCEEGRLDS